MSKIIGIDVSFGKCTVAVLQNDKPGVVGSFAADEYTPEVFSAAKNLAKAVLATDITQAVVAIPATKTAEYTRKVISAARKAELEIVRTLYNTSALAMGYGFINKECGTLCALCNYARGGFNFAVITNNDDMYQTMSISGVKEGILMPDKMIVDKCKSDIQKSEADTQKGKVLIIGECHPDVHNGLAEIFPVEVVRPEMIALGAAIQGAVLSGESAVKDVMLLEALATGIGIEVGNRECHFIIKRNTVYPTKQSIKIKPVDEDAENFIVHILMGNSNRAQANETLNYLKCTCDDYDFDNKEFTLTIDVNANRVCNIELMDSEKNVKSAIYKSQI